MAREVVWTEPAWGDLVAAADHIARDSVNYAATFVQEIREAAALSGRLRKRCSFLAARKNTLCYGC
jgi:plasmid stabilization system protein ParE